MPDVVLQFTDLHLFSDPATRLRGVPTGQTARAVLEFAREDLRQRGERATRIILSGDLAHDERAETYDVLTEMLGDWQEITSVIPGNHDHRESLRERFADSCVPNSPRINFSQPLGHWQLIGLDSHVPDEVAGELGQSQIDWLMDELTRCGDRSVTIFIHHPPFPIQSEWLDRIGLADGEALLDGIATMPQVRVVSAGHVHQEFLTMRGSLTLLTTPSCGVQFLPAASEFACDAVPPGFRRFEFEADTVVSEVVRLPHLDFPPDD